MAEFQKRLPRRRLKNFPFNFQKTGLPTQDDRGGRRGLDRLRAPHRKEQLFLLCVFKSEITVANVGDTRALLLKHEATRLSVDHKPDAAEERQRIEGLGFEVKNGRLMGTLAVSRAFGDFNLK